MTVPCASAMFIQYAFMFCISILIQDFLKHCNHSRAIPTQLKTLGFLQSYQNAEFREHLVKISSVPLDEYLLTKKPCQSYPYSTRIQQAQIHRFALKVIVKILLFHTYDYAYFCYPNLIQQLFKRHDSFGYFDNFAQIIFKIYVFLVFPHISLHS